jgi:hypothetical protein
VPSEFIESCRHLARASEAVRHDLMRCRHRVSKLLLAHGRVFDSGRSWTQRHRQWLRRQSFEQPPTELAFADLVAAVDSPDARKAALDERLSRLASDERLWPAVARLRAFRGIDTLTALCLHLELGGDPATKPTPWAAVKATPASSDRMPRDSRRRPGAARTDRLIDRPRRSAYGCALDERAS